MPALNSKERAKEDIKRLVEDFRSNYSHYKKLAESDVETKLVEELFINILGWNKNDFFKQENVRRGEKRGRADYTFYIGDKVVFFLEVKKVGMPLDKEADKQVISYALSRKVPLAVSTNFEQMNIFCVEQENALKNVFRTFKTPEDYFNNFSDLWFLSKESFEQGLLLKKAEEEGRLKRRVSIDKQLLDDLMRIRGLIASDIEKKYPAKYNINEKDDIVQRILDRLIFIRRCEDTGINPDNLTLGEIKHLPGDKAYPKLKNLFKRYDEVYNSGLFTVGRDNDCDKINIDGEIIKKLANYLYESKDSEYVYNFDWIDADVLGQVYEQYLGKILAQTKSGKAKLTEGQAHRKEQGIYYTPTYIVDYIVKNTVGELLKDKKVDVRKIKILDPACGSGSFLIKAFDYLDKHLSIDDNSKQRKLDSQGAYSVKTEILKNNIYGVDLDNKAVEITKLNLLLKAAEKNRKLPEELDIHVRHGNSLIDDEAVSKDAFHWAGDFQEGSFDVVIGNPPYVRQEELADSKKIFEQYKTFNLKNDLYVYFFERGLELLKEGGLFGFIVSSKFIKTDYGKELREFILNNSKIIQFIDFGDLPVFSEATTYPCIILLKKSIDKNDKNKILVSKIKSLDFSNLSQKIKSNSFYLKQSYLSKNQWILEDEDSTNLKKKIEKSIVSLNAFIGDKLYRGITTGCNEAFIIDEKTKSEIIRKDPQSKEVIRLFLTGKNIKRYSINFDNLYLIYAYTGIKLDDFQGIKEHLLKYKSKLQKVWEVKHGKHPWYELRGCSYYDKFDKFKIIYPRINREPNFALDEKGYLAQDSSFIIPSSSKYLLGLLNSKVIGYYAKQVCSLLRGGYYDYRYQYVELFPIKNPTPSQKNKIEEQVNTIISLHKQLQESGDKKTSQTAKLEEEIKKTDQEIDELVYEIYGITKEEQKIIEESLK